MLDVINLNEISQAIVTLIFVPLFTYIGKYLVDLIKTNVEKKALTIENERIQEYLHIISGIISQAVTSTAQTYVDGLKDKNIFTIETQKEAFQRTKDTVMKLLTEEAKEFIHITYGDLNLWIDTRIEQTLKELKK